MDPTKVSFLDVHASYANLKGHVQDAISRVMDSGHYIMGPELLAFEREFAQFTGSRFCVGVGNGLDALHLALKSLNIGPGDEVIVPAHTFIATWLAVTSVGANLVPVDCQLDTANINPDLIERAITRQTKAILPVHLYGQPADMVRINDIAKRHALFVIEDAAQSHGAMQNGVSAGALGHAASFSFYPGKNLGAFGDGGCVTTSDAGISEKVRELSNYGSQKKYVHLSQGMNSRLDEIQAAILRVKLQKLEDWNRRRCEIAQSYLSVLDNHSVIHPPGVLPNVKPVWHLFVVRVADRDHFQGYLRERGIQTLVHYPTPPYMQDAYRSLGIKPDDFPVATQLCREVVSLPIGPHLSREQESWVAEALAGYKA